MLLPGFVACRPVCTARRAQGCVSGAKAAPQGSGCCWWHSKAFLLPTSPHLGMQDEDAPSLPPSSVSVLVSLPPPALSISPPSSPPQLFFPLHWAVSGFRSSPSSKASPGSTAWGRGAPKFLGFVGFGCGMGTDITEPKKMQRGLLRVGPFLSVLGSVGSKTSA